MANNGIVRTKMAEAFAVACDPEALRGVRLSRVSRRVVHRVLTNQAQGIGVLYDPSRKKKKSSAAETAVMKEAA